MIDFGPSPRASYIRLIGDNTVSHAEKVLFLVAFYGKSIVGQPVQTYEFRKHWPKALFGVVFHSKYIGEAEDNGWIEHVRVGQYAITDAGLAHLESLTTKKPYDSSARTNNTELLVFSAKQAHDFDKLLRKEFASATSRVLIADSYVDGTIFDTLLSSIPPDVRVDLIYNNDGGESFHTIAKRYRIQFPNFHYGRYPKLHDRFIVVDGVGFIIGPSLKDATVNAPAIVVRVDLEQSKKLITLFTNIYKNIPKIM